MRLTSRNPRIASGRSYKFKSKRLFISFPHANSSHKPLVETDPAFTQYKQWLSSDYMLDALKLDPALMQKRLGDGFYEQQQLYLNWQEDGKLLLIR